MKRLASSLIGASLIFLVGFLIFFSNLQSVNAEVIYLDDDFESGNFNQWTGTRVSSGETIGVNSYRSLLGAYGGRVTTNGGGGVEYAYCYKKLTASELYVRGAFYIAKSGIVDEGDRFYLMAFQAGGNTLAGVGWRRIGGTVKWFLLIRSGTSSIITYSAVSPSLNRYYSVELYWKKDSINGEGQLWIGECLLPDWDNDWQNVCSITGRNTATYGDISEVRFGLPTVSYCGSTAVYFDCLKMSSEYIEPLAWGSEEAPYGYTVFGEGFESGSFGKWSGTNTYNRGTAKVVKTLPYAGTYSAQFTSGGTSSSGQAYCYKNICAPHPDLETTTWELQFLGRFKVTSCSMASSSGRFYLLRMWTRGTVVIAVGWEKIGGVLRWCLSMKDGATMVSFYSQNAPLLNKWCTVNLIWYPWEYGWGTSGCQMSISYVDESPGDYIGFVGTKTPLLYETIDRVDFGLSATVNCRSVVVYGDSLEVVAEWME